MFVEYLIHVLTVCPLAEGDVPGRQQALTSERRIPHEFKK